MARVRYNNQGGTITDNPLSAGATVVNSAAFASLPAISKPNYGVIVFEPGTTNEEVVYVMAHGQEAPLQGPEQPVTSVAASTLSLGTYEIVCTYVTADGETTPSGKSFPVTTTGGNAAITAKFGNANFPIPAGVTSVKFYIGAPLTDVTAYQLAGSATPSSGVATLVISANPTATNPPTSNGTSSSTACTIWRGREGSTASVGVGVSHATGSAWIMGPTARDLERPNSIGLTPEGWDDAVIWALYAGKIEILALGSSIMGGPNTGDTLQQGYPWRIAASLIATYGWGGDFYSPSLSSNWMSAYVGTPPYVFNVAPTAWLSIGPMLVARINNAAPNMVFTTPKICGSGDMVIWDAAGASGTMTWKVDSGGTQTYTYTGSGKMVRIPWTAAMGNGLTSTTHTITILSDTLAGGLGQFFLIGIDTYPGASGSGATGVFTAYCSWPGLPAGEWWRQDQTPSDKISLWSGPTVTGAPPYSALGFGFPFAPDWMIFDQPNDAITPYAYVVTGNVPTYSGLCLGPDLFMDALRRIIQAARAGSNNLTSLSVHLTNGPDDVNSDVSSSITGYNGHPYMMAMLNESLALKVHVENTTYDWGERAASLNFQMPTNPHPTPAGMQRIANLFLSRMP